MRLLVSNNGDTATARVSLCRPQNLVSKTIQARIRFEGNMGGSYLTASPLVSEGTRTVGSYGVTTLFPGQWEMMSFDYPTIFPLAPDILDAATEIGFTITGLYGALGSIYIDYVHIIPTP